MSFNDNKIHVLGIESSCDDTGVAIINQDGHVLSNCIHSQLKQHLRNGGIIPVVAKEYHLDNIDHVARRAFEKSGLKSIENDIDAIAVCTRPGLQMSLEVGFNYAKTLAKKYSKPLIPIHHMQAHALMPLWSHRNIKFPFISFLISGGHCLLAIAERYNRFKLLGVSRDDAPGDLLDKIARRFRLRNLGPPFDEISGGAAIELLSQRPGTDRFKYFNSEHSVPMLREKSCDFSFAGYRGTLENIAPMVDNLWRSGNRQALEEELGHLCGSFQRIILIQMAKKLQRALMFYKMHWRYKNENIFLHDDKTSKHLGFDLNNIDMDVHIVVSGGVAANSYFLNGLKLSASDSLNEEPNIYTPPKSLCSDNGLMIAWNGLLRWKDYLTNEVDFNKSDFDNGLVTDMEQFDQVKISQTSPIGPDIRDQVGGVNFDCRKFSHPELRLRI